MHRSESINRVTTHVFGVVKSIISIHGTLVTNVGFGAFLIDCFITTNETAAKSPAESSQIDFSFPELCASVYLVS